MSNPTILVYCVRHGNTTLNSKDSFRGPIDAPLDKKGWEDANQLASLFAPIELAYIFHSDMQRTRETARLISERNGAESLPQYNLRAWNVGDLGGQPKNEANILKVDYHVNHPDIPFPGGESLNSFKGRIHPLLDDAIDMSTHCGLPVMLVIHSSVIHEVGTMLGGSHDYTLVEPGGVAAIYMQDGKLDAKPIFKPKLTPSRQGENMT